jgi:MinD superfamily P-loop ATPase
LSREESNMTEMPVIDIAKCDGCGLCTGVCRCGALQLVGKVVAVVERVECDWCADCELVCPTGAIRCPFEIVIPKS